MTAERARVTRLKRANIPKQASSLENVAAPMLMPRITYANSPADPLACHAPQLCRFDGEKRVRLGGSISVGSST